VSGSLATIAEETIRRDPQLREMLGNNPEVPVLVVALSGEPISAEELAEFARAMLPGGDARRFYTPLNPDFARPGVFVADAFRRAGPIQPRLNRYITHPYVTSDHRTTGQFFPSRNFDAVAMPAAGRAFEKSDRGTYRREVDSGHGPVRLWSVAPW